MHKAMKLGAALTLLILTGAGGWWLGQQQGDTTAAAGASSERKILYYRNPMGLPDTSPVPKKDPMGMDYLPVYADEAGPGTPDGRGRILYYRNPMGLPDTSPVPKKDSMGMDYLPVYENEVSGPGQLRVSPEKIQKLGVRTTPAQKRVLQQQLRLLGRISLDESTQTVVAPRFEGWIEKLHVATTGQQVTRGQPLFEAWSPDIYAAAQEYQLALKGQQALQGASVEVQRSMASLPQASLRRLELLGVPAAEIQRLQRGGDPRRTLTVHAPASGIVLEKMATQGARFMAGEALFRLADTSRVWLLLDVPQSSLRLLRRGTAVQVEAEGWPGQSFSGSVDFIYPTLNEQTRTAQVRVVLSGTGGRLKPGQYAHARLQAGDEQVLAVPDSAVIDSGQRQVVLVAVGEGLFQARQVRTGARGDGWIAIEEGVGEGEAVVVAANFLLDAESNLQAALNGLQAKPAPASAPASAAPASDPHAGHGTHDAIPAAPLSRPAPTPRPAAATQTLAPRAAAPADPHAGHAMPTADAHAGHSHEGH